MAKRAFDLGFSVLVLAVCLMPSLVLMILIALETRAFPIYSQERMGRQGRPFRIHKFRTMLRDSDNIECYLDAEQQACWERERKVPDDPRVTKLGRFLRKTSLDEIPNFLDVLTGSLSVVGPRPITADELRWFGDDAKRLLSVKPGVTGWWQVQSRNESTYASGARQETELYYVDHASARLDLRILVMTVGAVVHKTGR